MLFKDGTRLLAQVHDRAAQRKASQIDPGRNRP